MGMIEDIVALLRLFEPHAIDRETHKWVAGVAADKSRWPDAHRVFNDVRRRWLDTTDMRRRWQYSFEEICLKTLFNETAPMAPFDSDSAYHVVPLAIVRARRVGVPVQKVLDIVAPEA